MAKVERLLQSYKPEDVDKYINTLMSEFSTKYKGLEQQRSSLVSDMMNLNNRIQQLSREVKEYERQKMLIAESIIKAKESSDSIMQSALSEKERIEQEAEAQAEAAVSAAEKEALIIREQAKTHAQAVTDEAQQKLDKIQVETADALKNRNMVIDEIKSSIDAEKQEYESSTMEKMKAIEAEYNNRFEEHKQACAKLEEEFRKKKTEVQEFKTLVIQKLEDLKHILS